MGAFGAVGLLVTSNLTTAMIRFADAYLAGITLTLRLLMQDALRFQTALKDPPQPGFACAICVRARSQISADHKLP